MGLWGPDLLGFMGWAGGLPCVENWSVGRDESSKSYTEDFPPKQFCDEIISKVDFEKQIDLSHLKNSKYVIKD